MDTGKNVTSSLSQMKDTVPSVRDPSTPPPPHPPPAARGLPPHFLSDSPHLCRHRILSRTGYTLLAFFRPTIHTRMTRRDDRRRSS